ncbi:MAG: cupin [Mycobacterium sp.]|jgi:hypothetical protein|nr:cupin [Mycobacterium sp.]MCX6479929.1 cupin [Mycobacterium sp.]
MRALRLGLGVATLVAVCAAPAAAAPGVEVEELSKNTVDGVEYLVAEITLAPGSGTGWHYHPGDVFGYVREGTLTHWDTSGGGGNCAVDAVYGTGAPVKEGTGAGFVHNGRNDGPTPLVLEVVYVNPVGTPLSVAVPGPAGCPVS